MKRIYTPVKKKTILIVDDDQVVVHTYREKLLSQGFNVEVAATAGLAMERLARGPLDLLILDLCLPQMNGVEALKDIRAQFDMTALPILVFSNPYLTNLGRTAVAAGANKCITKAESTPAKVSQLVRELLALSPLADDPSPSTSASVGHDELSATLLVDVSATLAKLRGSHQVFVRTEDEQGRATKLCEMHRQVRLLDGAAAFLGYRKSAQMANALEALLIELQAKPKKITPSVIRTIAQGLDTLAYLFEQARDSQIEMPASQKILVVDDEIISRETICSALERASLTATSFDDSFAAQEVLEKEHFDLIFLDVEMPGQNGFELCVKIREMANNRTTPVVFVTAHSDFGNRAQSALSGGNDFIAKPFLLVELAVKALTLLFRPSSRSTAVVTPAVLSPVA